MLFSSTAAPDDRLRGGPASALCASAVVLGLGVLGWALKLTMLAPPLGVTALLLCRDPFAPTSAPRSICVGHAVGVGAGLLSLALFRVAPVSALADEFTLRHALASSVAVGLTAFGTDALRSPHPPAGATTLVVSLGVLREPSQLLAFGGGVLLCAVAAFAARRLGERGRGPAASVDR